MGLPDPRAQGSGNPGATNVMRIGGKKAAGITLFGDMLKGLIPVLIAQALNVGPLILSAVVFAAFVGHLYPVFFRFQRRQGGCDFIWRIFWGSLDAWWGGRGNLVYSL
ncbi:Acyl-phosphate:glycerol-3-phosphate O-acyltransferase PlsY [methanotrophic endosymbiont of Bathymodiolus azoricus (Menez Gwen)]|nr:Acyl-phosphate:glycerol-3-phosphate O-acyltransferase PlsY [methanotrophic endosymbiont of Bathymodiolus azoricus (Menez Gwen)]